jgi:hypothetical protein
MKRRRPAPSKIDPNWRGEKMRNAHADTNKATRPYHMYSAMIFSVVSDRSRLTRSVRQAMAGGCGGTQEEHTRVGEGGGGVTGV